MTFFETLYYAECEGLLPTRAGRLNAAIRVIKSYPGSSIDMDEFEKILNDYGLSYNDLSEREIRYINASIA